MTSVLSLSASSPLREPHSQHSCGRSWSSIGSANSSGTVHHHRLHSHSGSSLSSLASLWTPSFRRHDEGTPPRSPSLRDLTLRRIPTLSDRRSESGSYSRRTSVTSILSSRLRSEPTLAPDQDEPRLSDLTENDGKLSEVDENEHRLIEEEEEDDILASRDASHDCTPITPSEPDPNDKDVDFSSDTTEPLGLRRWLSTLRRRKVQCQPKATPKSHRLKLDERGTQSSPTKRRSRHGVSDSQGSSLAFVTAVKSATATLASVSIASVSRGNAPWRRGHQRSSLISGSDPRPSIDSQRSMVDEPARLRSRKRREKLDELLQTEENYIADVKALANVYYTIIGHQPTSASFAREPARKNIAEILHLHTDLLCHLHRVVPFAYLDQQPAGSAHEIFAPRPHARWHSVDAVPTRATSIRSRLASIRDGRRSLNIDRSSDDDHEALRCSPHVVAAVAGIFSAHMRRFVLYEEYGANYELIQRDIDETQRATATWSDFDKAIEALSAHINPVKSREANRKKAMTVKDLLIKPIQRVPRYALLFNDLCRLTPVCDDPDSNASIQEVLTQLKWLCHCVNEAKNDTSRSRMLEVTWLLGDRLTFSNQVPRSVYLQLLGQVHLCGCLYVTWRNKDRIKGSYMICVLFGSTLLLASADDDPLKYTTLAGIPLATATMVESDNGKGLQCHTTPHCWKLVFEHSARMYEFILTACSEVEAKAWRHHMNARIDAQSLATFEGSANVFELQSPLISEMRSVGTAFGKPGSFVRRMSVHRTATVGPTTDLNQVIIKNTQAVKEALDNSSNTSLQIPRSQSVVTPSHVQTLAPRRAERVRLESLLSDVWTKDSLPYPGMQPRRSDPIRASANHVIRKFSMASITSNFSSSKRSASYTSIVQSKKEDMPPPKTKNGGRNRAYTRPSRPPLVDFHNAPEAFLPADFELQDPSTKRNKSALRTLTMTMERPFSPLLGNESKTPGLRRAQSLKTADEVHPTLLPNVIDERIATPAYSVVQEHSRTPAKTPQAPVSEETTYCETLAKTPRKSKSKNKLFRLFG